MDRIASVASGPEKQLNEQIVPEESALLWGSCARAAVEIANNTAGKINFANGMVIPPCVVQPSAGEGLSHFSRLATEPSSEAEATSPIAVAHPG